MISYKKIKIFDLKYVDGKVLYIDQEDFCLKSPILLFSIDKSNNTIKLKCNNSKNNLEFLNLINSINIFFKKYSIDKVTINNEIIVEIDDNSRFFDENKREISFKNILSNKCICSLIFPNNNIILKQLLLI